MYISIESGTGNLNLMLFQETKHVELAYGIIHKIVQADTSLRSVSSCPSPLRGSVGVVGVLAHAGPCYARHTLSGLAALCRTPRPYATV